MKVNISNSKLKKSYFPISLDSSTTANFGECLPLFCHELPPKSHCTINIRDAVRFAPLSFPTFGKAFLKTYTFCHKISDLYPPFNDLLAQTPYTAYSGNTYIPQVVPCLPLYMLWLSVISNCEFTFYKTDLSKVTSYDSESSHPFVVSQLSYEKVSTVTADNYTLSDMDVSGSLSLFILNALWNGTFVPNSVSSKFGSAKVFFDYMKTNTGGTPAIADNLFFNKTGSNIGSVYCSGKEGSNGRKPVTPGSSDFIVPLNRLNIYYLKYFPNSGGSSYFGSVSADNFVQFASEFGEEGDSTLKDTIVCIRLTDSGKFLRKILMGLHYQVAPLDREVSVLPLFAYFKSYFDTFAPKRFVKFDQTSFSRLINSCVNTGLTVADLITYSPSGNPTGLINSDIGWNNIIDDLLSCYYTKNTDYFSAQIIGMINDYGADLTRSYMGVYKEPSGDESPELFGMSSRVDQQTVPAVDLSETTQHTQAQQNILSRLTQFVNRRSVLGSKISALLKSVFGISPSEVNEQSPYVGSDSIDVNFGDVFSTAETSEASLGEYAGKAVASGSGGVYNVNTDTHSIILSFSVIVPRTQYVQGLSPLLCHVRADDFYNPMFDGLTLLPTNKSALYCGDGLFNHSDYLGSFGNLPIYSEYKTKICGVLSGDLSLPSTKATYDSFTMDEIISSSTSIVDASDTADPNKVKGIYNNIQYDFNKLVCGTMWRYLGRWLWLGRFDRIFVNNRVNYQDFLSTVLPASVDGDIQSSRNTIRTDDNLIVHHVVDLNTNAPMVPLAGSFMTDDMLSLDRDGVMVQSE